MIGVSDVTPMKMEEIEVTDFSRYATDDAWVAEQKVDGVHMTVRVGAGRQEFVGFGGSPLNHAASALHFPVLRDAFAGLAESGIEAVFDGELLPSTGDLWLYDLPLLRVGGESVEPSTPFEQRRAALETLFLSGVFDGAGTVRLLPQSTSAADKMALFAAVCENGGEGVVLKRVDAPWRSGQRVRTQLKAKFVKTADVVVTARNTGGHTNATLAVYANGVEVPVGGCSMIGKPDAQVGDVIEVRYLYWTGESLYQPRMTRIRTDKAAGECTSAQFSLVSKEVLAA